MIHTVHHKMLGLVTVSKSFIVDEGDVVLIDTGLTGGSAGTILSKLKEMGRDPKDVELCILTHRHRDHVGGLKRLKEACGFRVAAHRMEAEAIEKATGVQVDESLNDGDVISSCGGIRVVHVPGHTAGNICLLLGNVLFSGDAFFGNEGSLRAPPTRYSSDPEAAKRNLTSLVTYDFDVIYTSHGRDIVTGAKDKYHAFLKGLDAA